MEQLNYKLEVFEGPMDLLLHLISKHKLNINDIPIVELVNQYLDYVRQMEAADFDVAGDFLEMAARLIYIKTVSLLPRHEEAEKLKTELTGELIEYRDCKLMAEKLSKQTDGFNRYVRDPPIDSFKAIVARKFVNVASKISTVMRKLWSGKKVKFLKLFEGAETKSDLVATFLAVLELAKTKKISIEGTMNNPEVQIINEVETIE